ncbi:MAG: DUF1549 domain-containing protein, partial [Acidobacteriaceae bacterium]|nr:DUF1549 domain-containing protein [Acidobacteriaceae bacterium]
MRLRIIAVIACRFSVGLLAADTTKFQTDVLPILQKNCIGCHGGAKPQAGLSLQSIEDLLHGGQSGPAVRPGKPDASLVIEKLVSKKMPPTPEKLSDAEIARIRQWIGESTEFAPPTEADVLPIVQMRCVVCHGKRKQEGGLDLRTLAGQMKGGKSGPAVVPGNPDASLMMKRITSGEMPPPKLLVEYFVRPPSSDEVEVLRKWIAGGAKPAPAQTAVREQRPITEKDRSHWAFQAPKRPAVPGVAHADLVRNPLDAFLLAKLEQKNLSYNAPAKKLTLLRRATLDATGLPPTPQEIDAFLADNRPDAYERLVDRLLASPHFGERWARFWLDAAGYSDSEGIIDEDLIRGNAWRYRDYVIRSLNEDKPYNQFLTEQIAGDELVDYRHAGTITPDMRGKLVATGFLRQVPDGTYSPANGSVPERVNVIADEIEVLSSSVMGITLGCARCHDHKYDPLRQRDYYRLSAVLQTAYDPYDWVKPTERYLDLAPEEERKKIAVQNAPIEAEMKKIEAG